MIDIKTHDLNIEISDFAAKQLHLILENDYTLHEQVLRLMISGKGCSGFDYSIGFTKAQDDDLIYQSNGLKLHLDPFTAYYAKEGKIDFVFDHHNGIDGFLFTNFNEKNHKGKFFKNTDMLPKFI